MWAERTVGSMEPFRRALWPVVQPLGTVYARGAFYFLVPVPDLVSGWSVYSIAVAVCSI